MPSPRKCSYCGSAFIDGCMHGLREMCSNYSLILSHYLDDDNEPLCGAEYQIFHSHLRQDTKDIENVTCHICRHQYDYKKLLDEIRKKDEEPILDFINKISALNKENKEYARKFENMYG